MADDPMRTRSLLLGALLLELVGVGACTPGTQEVDREQPAVVQSGRLRQQGRVESGAELGAASEIATETSAVISPPRAQASSWRMLPWDTTLSAGPRAGAPGLTLAADKDCASQPGRVVEVLGEVDGWWKVRTVDAARLRAVGLAGLAPIEGLDVYALDLYVPVGTGAALEPGGDDVATANGGFGIGDGEEGEGGEDDERDEAKPMQQSNAALALPAPLQAGGMVGDRNAWELDPGSDVFWPDGTLAGAVARAHTFLVAGVPRSTPAGELRCFPIRVGPGKSDAELCFEADAVRSRPADRPQIAVGDQPYNGNGGGKSKPSNKDYGESLDPAGKGTVSGQIRLQKAKAEGIDAEAARRVVRSHLAEVRHCYSVALHAGNAPEGTLTLWVSVDRKGEVIETSARGVDELFATCVAEKAQGWLFPSGMPGSVSIAMECTLE